MVKLPWPYRSSYFIKEKKHRHSIRRGLVLWCFCHCLVLIGNFAMVDSLRSPKSLGIDPKKTLQNTKYRFFMHSLRSQERFHQREVVTKRGR